MITCSFSRDEGMGSLWSGMGGGHLPKLRALELPQNAIGDDDLGRLADALCRGACPKLRVLDLTTNCIGDAGLAALARAMCSEQPDGRLVLDQLVELKLGHNLIGDGGARHLADAVSGGALRNLIELHLDCNLMTDQAAGSRSWIPAPAIHPSCPYDPPPSPPSRSGESSPVNPAPSSPQALVRLSKVFRNLAGTLDMLYLNNNNAGEPGKRAVRQAMAVLNLVEGDSFFV